MTEKTLTATVAHLGGSTVGYRFARPFDPALPTLVLINSYGTSADLYRPQFADATLAGTANLLAIEPYGHGETRAPIEQYTYWDSAIASLQVLDALGIGEAFALGTSQGGWITPRMAMLAPRTVRGIMLLGTSMDSESPESRERGCWDAVGYCTSLIDELAEPVGDDWVVPDEFIDGVLDNGLGNSVTAEDRRFWHEAYPRNYTGDAGRARVRVNTVNLRDRDGLHGRLDAVRCPVLWLHGTADAVYSVRNAEDGIRRFVNSANAELRVIEGGRHLVNLSDPDPVNAAATDFVRRWK